MFHIEIVALACSETTHHDQSHTCGRSDDKKYSLLLLLLLLYTLLMVPSCSRVPFNFRDSLTYTLWKRVETEISAKVRWTCSSDYRCKEGLFEETNGCIQPFASKHAFVSPTSVYPRKSFLAGALLLFNFRHEL
mmetsp:Transcript_553/g.1012  ORF Transcript_553/g.1012 Transcript_553/m.1012 type:complete len:134 (+) Transcript_553:719-1120(+)